MRLPNLNALRMFDAAARHLNFRLAAEDLNLTQGAVAQQVRRLETDLGFKLFERKARGLELTDTGRDYHAPISRALTLIQDATAKLKPEPTRIRISVPPSFATKWLIPRLDRFSLACPDIDLQIIASDRLSDFSSDGIDIAIRISEEIKGKRLWSTRLAPLQLCAVCSPDYVDKPEPVNDIENLMDHRFIQDSHNSWDALFEKLGTKSTKRIIQVNQTALAMDAAANGQGIALAPYLLVQRDVAKGALFVLWRDKEGDQEAYHIVYPANGKTNGARQAIVEWLLSETHPILGAPD